MKPASTKSARGTAKPSTRLAAQKPGSKSKAGAAAQAKQAKQAKQAAPIARDTDTIIVIKTASVGKTEVLEKKVGALLKPTKMRVATKFVVTDKTEVPVVVGKELRTRWQVKLEAAYEARSILNGLATEQGNPDNRIFGDDSPEAAIGMVIHSKAIADTFMTGHAFEVVFSEIVG